MTEGVSPSQTDAKQEQVNPSANGTVSADSIPPESKQKTGVYVSSICVVCAQKLACTCILCSWIYMHMYIHVLARINLADCFKRWTLEVGGYFNFGVYTINYIHPMLLSACCIWSRQITTVKNA